MAIDSFMVFAIELISCITQVGWMPWIDAENERTD